MRRAEYVVQKNGDRIRRRPAPGVVSINKGSQTANWNEVNKNELEVRFVKMSDLEPERPDGSWPLVCP